MHSKAFAGVCAQRVTGACLALLKSVRRVFTRTEPAGTTVRNVQLVSAAQTGPPDLCHALWATIVLLVLLIRKSVLILPGVHVMVSFLHVFVSFI